MAFPIVKGMRAIEFGQAGESRESLNALVLDAHKRATAGHFERDYQDHGEPLEHVGERLAMLNSAGEHVATLRVTKAEVVPFAQVSDELAVAEGEGDFTGDEFRAGYSKDWVAMGYSCTETTPVATVYFDLVEDLRPAHRNTLANFEVAHLTRAGRVESVHQGLVALTAPNGVLLDSIGDSSLQIFPRSAVKPIQVVAMLRAGLNLAGAELAICAGSHQGTANHTGLVQQILTGVGLADSALQCPPAWPGNAAARKLADSETRLAFNCSGKHAGFLATCVAAGWSIENYLDPEHPLQVLVKQVLEEYSGEKVELSTIDGCGAPLHTLSVAGLARSIGRVASSNPVIAEAMIQNAWAVGGEDSPDTLVMREGLVAKLGAEGVFVVGLPSGHGVAVKIADGSLRAAPLVALKMLAKHNLIDAQVYERLLAALAVNSMGGNQVIGQLVAL